MNGFDLWATKQTAMAATVRYATSLQRSRTMNVESVSTSATLRGLPEGWF